MNRTVQTRPQNWVLNFCKRTNDFISSRSKNLTHLKHLREHTEADFLMLCSFLDIPSYMGILMPLLEALVISYFLEETLDYCLIIIYLRVVHFAPKGGI